MIFLRFLRFLTFSGFSRSVSLLLQARLQNLRQLLLFFLLHIQCPNCQYGWNAPRHVRSFCIFCQCCLQTISFFPRRIWLRRGFTTVQYNTIRLTAIIPAIVTVREEYTSTGHTSASVDRFQWIFFIFMGWEDGYGCHDWLVVLRTHLKITTISL